VSKRFRRRQIVKALGAACGAWLIPSGFCGAEPEARIAPIDIERERQLRVAGQAAEIQISTVSEHTFRLSVLPIVQCQAAAIPSLVQRSWGEPLVKLRGQISARTIRCGNFRVRIEPQPLTFFVESPSGEEIQRLRVDEATGAVLFTAGNAPLFGLGEGGKQLDRRGSADSMRNGEDVPDLATAGARVPIPWIISAAGWAIFHQPLGAFDFTGAESKFRPGPDSVLPLDLFLVGSREPTIVLSEYAGLTGMPETPPLWSFGYQQSHRTLANREEILDEAATFRRKKLPCDALIYLGTGFCPSGWNTANGSFVGTSACSMIPRRF
jgi:alpha-glucosidase (family GH31 glycosyl hydrolase)